MKKQKLLSPTRFSTVGNRYTRSNSPLLRHSFLMLIITMLYSSISFTQVATAPKKQYLPITDTYFPSLVVRSSTVPILGGDHFDNIANVTNANTTDAATRTLTALDLTPVWLEVENTASEVFPAGSYAGFVVNESVLQLGLLSGTSIETYLDGSLQETATSTSILNSGISDTAKVGFITTLPFDRVRINFTGLDVNILTALLTTLGADATTRIYYAEVVLSDSWTLPACNNLTPVVQNTFPAVVQYGTSLTPALGNIADVNAILNNINNVTNVVNSNTTDAATVTTNVGVTGGAYISVKLLQDTVPAGYFAGFDIEEISLLNLSLLNGLTIEVLNNGTVVQTNSGVNLLEAGVLSGSSRQTVGLIAQVPFDEIRISFTQGLLGLNLGVIDVYNAVIKSFCPPSPELGSYTLLANGTPTAKGMGVAVNADRSGLVGTEILGFSESLDNLVDADSTNYVAINGSVLGPTLASSATLSVITPGHTFVNDEYVGFIVRGNAGLIDLGALTGITITTYNNGAPGEVVSNSSLLNLNALGLLTINSIPGGDGMIIGFKTTQDFDEVAITVDGLASVGNELQVFGAFVADGNQVLPVTFGLLSAIVKDGKLIVSWSTLSEINNQEFTIEVSKDGKTFHPIGKVGTKAPDGNSSSELTYNFTKDWQQVALLSFGSLISAVALFMLVMMWLPGIKRRKILIVPLFAIIFSTALYSCSKKDHSFDPGTESVFVRIAQTDKDGKTTYSKVVKAVVQ